MESLLYTSLIQLILSSLSYCLRTPADAAWRNNIKPFIADVNLDGTDLYDLKGSPELTVIDYHGSDANSSYPEKPLMEDLIALVNAALYHCKSAPYANGCREYFLCYYRRL